jgi:ParB-like nuclease domain
MNEARQGGSDMNFRRVPIDRIVVDDRYQRELSSQVVNRIARNFDERQLGVLEVAARGDGTYAVFDGQHRLKALRQLRHTVAPCMVHDDLTPEIEAELFVRLQRERRPVTPLDRFHAGLFAGSVEAQELKDAVEAAGYEIARHSGGDRRHVAMNNRIRAIVALERLYRTRGPAGVRSTLQFINEMWGHDEGSTTGDFMLGVSLFLRSYEHKMTDQARANLQAVSPVVILRRSAGRLLSMSHAHNARMKTIADELRRTAKLRGRPRAEGEKLKTDLELLPGEDA